MAICSTCGNDYELTFHVRTHEGNEYDFDSIECAAAKVAPQCDHCGCTVLGHGIQSDSTVYCCANCARHADVEGVNDNAVAR
jgi:DNA-directed RNA polymerase subunit RPC12/RpoP